MTNDEKFALFWKIYPHRIAKLAARRAFIKAIKLATVEEIIAGVERYIQHKPEHIAYCHPASFLNGGRWDDCPAPEPKNQVNGNTKAQILRDDLKRIDARIQWLLGQRPLNPKLAAELTNAKANREMVFKELRKLI